MKKLFLSVFVLSGMLFAGTASADEGMWLPSLIYKYNISDMQQMGCELSAEDIYSINSSSLKDAIVALDRGSCTGEMVSDRGLMLTNHHCGFGEIQSHSSVDHDYLRNGFWARTYADELPNPGKTVSFLVRVEDVTDKILNITNVNTDNREAILQMTIMNIQKAAIEGTHYEAYVRPLFNGNRYYLFVMETFRDVRLVGAPPRSIGKFGGDTDNWMWPRHTGDFCLFRVYCGPNGKPADYAEENVPYSPRHHLTISLNGYEEGDFAMIMGFPGSTNRYQTSFGVNYTMNVTNPVRIEVREVKLDIIRDYMNTSQKANIQYASKYARSSNYYKYSIGQNKGLEALNVIDKKQEKEKAFEQWYGQTQEKTNKYGKALEIIQNAYDEGAENMRAYDYLAETLMRGPEIFSFALSAKALFEALQKEDQERIDEITERMKAFIDDYFKDYDASTDRKITAAMLALYNQNISPDYYPSFFGEINKKYKGDSEAFAANMFAKTVFADREKLLAFLDSPKLKTLEKDPAFNSALSLFDLTMQMSEARGKTMGEINNGNRMFVAGLMEMDQDHTFYPDANSTLRLTYGKVGGYLPRDGVEYSHFTTVKGYMEKEIPGDLEFDVPERLKELYREGDYGRYADKDDALYTCFITNNDITGGNSGSPVMNSKGQLIGIAFDGNWEAMSGDIAFEPQLQRCINVDIRFVMWVIDKFAGATHLIDEMTVVR